jgi:hypothetical protein
MKAKTKQEDERFPISFLPQLEVAFPRDKKGVKSATNGKKAEVFLSREAFED